MTLTEQKRTLASAVKAAKAAGALMRKNLNEPKKINASWKHDIKLELDVRCQKLIEKMLREDFPKIALLGEEGVAGDQKAELRWVVDPIDGTVNFTHGIPHACVSIALQIRSQDKKSPEDYETLAGVVFDPFCNELWTAVRGQAAYLNGKKIRVSNRKHLSESMISLGYAKSRANLDRALPYYNSAVRRVRKIRQMGSAALAMVYVASGRFDAYLERGIRLWDIAAGGLIVECAGGEFWRRPVAGQHAYEMIVSNGLLRKKLENIG
jgi:myo-inositol-1(or 4)-monophosphatase